MTISEQRKIFASNLLRYVEKSGKQQKEVAKDLGYSYTTFNTWIRGTSMPNAAKIQTIADYFGIMKSDLLDKKVDDANETTEKISIEGSAYYFNDETAELAQAMYRDEDLRFLADSTRKMSPKDIKALTAMAQALIRKDSGRNE